MLETVEVFGNKSVFTLPEDITGVHNELNYLWMCSGMNEFVAKTLGNYCKCSLRKEK